MKKVITVDGCCNGGWLYSGKLRYGVMAGNGVGV